MDTRVNMKRRMLQFCTAVLTLLIAFSMLSVDAYAASSKKPARVTNVKLSSSTTKSLSVKWGKAKNAKKYQIAYKKASAKKYKYVTLKKGKRSYVIKKLKANTQYRVKVRGINGKKKGKWSKVKKFKTKKVKATGPDTNTNVDYTKAANEKKVKVSVGDDKITITVASLGKSGSGTLYAVAANKYMSGDEIKGLAKGNDKGRKIGTLTLNKSKTFKVDRFASDGYDRLYDKYYIVKDGKIVRGPVYATEIASKRTGKVEKDVPSKKGLVDELDEQCFTVSEDIGSNWTAFNIDLTELILANETADGKPIDNSKKNTDTIEVNGNTYYINKSYVSHMDSYLRRYEKMDINVVGIVVSFVSTEADASYPRALKYIDDARWTNGFNTSNDLGRDYFIAGMEYLADRYSKGGKGLICDYVIGNEIDYTYDWYEIVDNESKTGEKLPPRGSNMGLRKGEIEVRAPFDTFMEEYSRTLRLANLAVKKYADDVTVGVSLSKEWAMNRAGRENLSRTKNKRYDSYAPREILDWLNYFSKKRGDYDWTLTPHNYPMANGNAAAYETTLSEDSSRVLITGDPDTSLMITLNNLEVLQLYLDRSYCLYNKKPREVFFTENGSSSGSETGAPDPVLAREQAAEIAQYYYRAASLPSIKALIYYKMVDRDAEGATSFKLGLFDTDGNKKPSYEVWKYIDTNRSFEVSKEYLDSISYYKIGKDGKPGKEYSAAKGNIKSYRDLMEIVDSDFNWDKYWDEEALTPVKIEEEADERSLETDKAEYHVDDPILVTARGYSSDVVGIYKNGESPANAKPIYSYKVGGDDAGVRHKSGRQYDLCAYSTLSTSRAADAKLPAGEYSIILSRGDEEYAKKDIKLTGESAFDSAKIVRANKSTYSVGEDIIVRASGTDKDWVGIYKVGETPSGTVNSYFWYYVNDAAHIPGKPTIIQNNQSNSRASVLPEGQYVLILMENNGYNIISKSETITIESSGEAANCSIDSIEYELDNPTDGFANGTVTITKKEESNASACIMYWADENGTPLKGYTALSKFHLDDKVTTHRMQANTIIPPGAKTLIAYGASGSSKSDNYVMTKLPDGCTYELEDDYDVCFPVISDLHVVDKGSGNDFNENTNYHTTMALEDIVKTMPDNIGVFVNGDMADHGKASEFKTLLNLYMGVEDAPTMHLVVGNHDWRTGNPDGQLQKYANLFNPAVEPENIYYDEWVDGYHFIYMGSEGEGTIAYISREQLEWLDALLEEDSKNDPNRPVFLFLHEGLMDSMAGNYPGQWGYTNGVFQDSEIKSIVSKHGQVVMFGGHTHYDLNTENTVTVGSEDFPVCVNTSAVGYLWDAFNFAAGEYLYGAQGQYLKVFDDKIYIFGRDFITGEYIPSAMYVVEPAKLTAAKSKLSMKVGDATVNLGVKTEDGFQLTYSSSDPRVAKVDSSGNVRAAGAGTAKIYISTESSDTKAINRKIVYVTVTK